MKAPPANLLYWMRTVANPVANFMRVSNFMSVANQEPRLQNRIGYLDSKQDALFEELAVLRMVSQPDPMQQAFRVFSVIRPKTDLFQTLIIEP